MSSAQEQCSLSQGTGHRKASAEDGNTWDFELVAKANHHTRICVFVSHLSPVLASCFSLFLFEVEQTKLLHAASLRNGPHLRLCAPAGSKLPDSVFFGFNFFFEKYF